jgi:arylsulfatase A-like enzyme
MRLRSSTIAIAAILLVGLLGLAGKILRDRTLMRRGEVTGDSFPAKFDPTVDRPPLLVTSFDFDRDDDPEGWEPAESALPGEKLKVKDGRLYLPRMGASQSSLSRETDLDAGKINLIAVHLSAANAKDCGVEWQPEIGRSGTFPQSRYSSDKAGCTYYIAVGQSALWKGSIKRLKLVFLKAPKKLAIDWIHLLQDDRQSFVMRAGKTGYVLAGRLEWVTPISIPGKFQREISVPQSGTGAISCGLSKEAWQSRLETVTVRVSARVNNGESREISTLQLRPKASHVPWRWESESLDLRPWAGRQATLTFEVGPPASKAGGLVLLVNPPAPVSPKVSPGPRYNFVILLVDALRRDHLSIYGYGRQTSPRLAQLAGESIVFDHSFAQSFCTNLSVTSLFTSRFPLEAKVRASGYFEIKKALVTFPQRLQQAGYRTAAFSANPLVNWDYGYEAGFDTFYQNRAPGEILNEEAVRWLKANGGEPFLLYLHYMDVHAHYQPPANFRSLFLPAGYLPTDKKVWNGEASSLNSRIEEQGYVLPRQDLDYLMGLYDGGIAHADSCIGSLLAELKKMGSYNNTVIVVLADHGEEFLDHGKLEHTPQLYNELVRVPLILRLPASAGRRGERVSSQVRLLDVYPTLMELAGLPIPSDIRGQSLLAAKAEREAYAESPSLAAISAGGWKLIDKPGEDRDELYNFAREPAEKNNLIASHPEKAAALRARIARLSQGKNSAVAARQKLKDIDPKTLEKLKALGYLK